MYTGELKRSKQDNTKGRKTESTQEKILTSRVCRKIIQVRTVITSMQDRWVDEAIEKICNLKEQKAHVEKVLNISNNNTGIIENEQGPKKVLQQPQVQNTHFHTTHTMVKKKKNSKYGQIKL